MAARECMSRLHKIPGIPDGSCLAILPGRLFFELCLILILGLCQQQIRGTLTASRRPIATLWRGIRM